MSFAVHARRVRDASLPMGRRVSALGSCVQLFRPYGYTGTLAYLELEVGPFQCDGEALVRALELLEARRARWKAEVAAFAEVRRVEKRAGRRTPSGPTPFSRPEDLAAGARWREILTATRRAHRLVLGRRR
ncbi:hypothetical protein Q5530_21670 [Saccharothrix sp. BKS2]|uniref:DivIVA domain-containing protein n=1 Tax=Saccharothrix lopnurensis TaxID=1670621 RepID=A0ABW1PGX5_9PSEU